MWFDEDSSGFLDFAFGIAWPRCERAQQARRRGRTAQTCETAVHSSPAHIKSGAAAASHASTTFLCLCPLLQLIRSQRLSSVTRHPENSKRAHLRAPAFENTTKIPREDTQRDTKRAKMGAGEEKKREILGPHPLGPHPLGARFFLGLGPTRWASP